MLQVRLAGTRLGQDEWGVWDTEKGDWIRDRHGLVEARTSQEAAQSLKEYIERVGMPLYRTIPKPEEIARGGKAYAERLAHFAGAPLEDLHRLQRMARRWEESMLWYIGDPLSHIRRDIASLSRRILGRPGAPPEVQGILDRMAQAPMEEVLRTRHQLAEIARSLGIRVREEW